MGAMGRACISSGRMNFTIRSWCTQSFSPLQSTVSGWDSSSHSLLLPYKNRTKSTMACQLVGSTQTRIGPLRLFQSTTSCSLVAPSSAMTSPSRTAPHVSAPPRTSFVGTYNEKDFDNKVNGLRFMLKAAQEASKQKSKL